MIYRIQADINVTDEEALIEYARERFQACWKDALDSNVLRGESLVERALLEAVFFSNENPSPDEWGVEFLTGEVECQGEPEQRSSIYRGIE